MTECLCKNVLHCGCIIIKLLFFFLSTYPFLFISFKNGNKVVTNRKKKNREKQDYWAKKKIMGADRAEWVKGRIFFK